MKVAVSIFQIIALGLLVSCNTESNQTKSRLQVDSPRTPKTETEESVCEQEFISLAALIPRYGSGYFEKYMVLDPCFDQASFTITDASFTTPFSTVSGISFLASVNPELYSFYGILDSSIIDTTLLPAELSYAQETKFFYIVKVRDEPYALNQSIAFQVEFPDGQIKSGHFQVRYDTYQVPRIGHQSISLDENQNTVQVELQSSGGNLQDNKYMLLSNPLHGRIENISDYQRSFTYILEDGNFSGLETLQVKVYDDSTGNYYEDFGTLTIRVKPRVINTSFTTLNDGHYLDGDDNDKRPYYAYFSGNPKYKDSVNTYTHIDGTLYLFPDSKRVGKHMMRRTPEGLWEVLTHQGWKHQSQILPKSLFPYHVTMGMELWSTGHPSKVVGIVDINPMAAQEVNFDIHNDHAFITLDLETGHIDHRVSAVDQGVGDLSSNFSAENYKYISPTWRGSAFNIGVSQSRNLAFAPGEALLVGTSQANFFNSSFIQASLYRESTKSWVNFRDNTFPAYHNGSSEPIPPQLLASDLTYNSTGSSYKNPLVTFNQSDNAYILTFTSGGRRASRLDKASKQWTHWDGQQWGLTSGELPTATNTLAAVSLGQYSFFIYHSTDSILALPYNGLTKKFESELVVESGISLGDAKYLAAKVLDSQNIIILLKRENAIITKKLNITSKQFSQDNIHFLAELDDQYYPTALHIHNQAPHILVTEELSAEKSRLLMMGQSSLSEGALDWTIPSSQALNLDQITGQEVNQFKNSAVFDYNGSSTGTFYGAQPTGHMSLTPDYLFTTGINVQAAFAFDRNHLSSLQTKDPIPWSGWQLFSFPGAISALPPSNGESGKILIIDDLVNSTTNKNISDIQVWDYEQGLIPVRTYSPDTRNAGQPLRHYETRGLNYAADMAIDSVNKLVYVTEKFNHQIKVYSIGTDRLNYVRSFGEKGSLDGELHSPEGVDIDHDGNLWVVDAQNHRLQKFSPAGDHLLSIGQKGVLPGEFLTPYSVSADKKTGKVYVSDIGNHRIQIFETNGSYITSWSNWEPSALGVSNILPSFAKNQFSDITSVVADDNDVYVGVHNTIVRFKMTFPKLGPVVGSGQR